MIKLSLLKAHLLVLLLVLTYKPVKANSVQDILLFAAPFLAMTASEKVFGWGNNYEEPDFDAMHNSLVRSQSLNKKLHLYSPGACVAYEGTDRKGVACKLKDGSWKIQ